MDQSVSASPVIILPFSGRVVQRDVDNIFSGRKRSSAQHLSIYVFADIT
jgi:hypothetical protein